MRPSFPPSERPAISANRREKRSLTRRCRLFAVRHRLRRGLLASGCPPLMVELFTASGFAGGPRPRSWAGPACRQAEAPHASQVERTFAGLAPDLPPGAAVVRTPLGGILTPLNDRGLERGSRSVPVALHHETIPSSDRTSGLLRRGGFWPTTPALALDAGLLRRASVEPDEHVSAYPALRDGIVAGG